MRKLMGRVSVAFAASLLASMAIAGDAQNTWRLVSSVGDVAVSSNGLIRVAINPSAELAEGTVVTTGVGGRVVLRRGDEQIVLSPQSRVTLTGENDAGTHITQDMGSVLFNIGKRKKPHFEVDTPFLAAIVKGTAFTVSVNDESSAVHVREGAVEVATPWRNAVTLVKPGSTVRVRSALSTQIEVMSGAKVSRTIASNEGGWQAVLGGGAKTGPFRAWSSVTFSCGAGVGNVMGQREKKGLVGHLWGIHRSS